MSKIAIFSVLLTSQLMACGAAFTVSPDDAPETGTLADSVESATDAAVATPPKEAAVPVDAGSVGDLTVETISLDATSQLDGAVDVELADQHVRVDASVCPQFQYLCNSACIVISRLCEGGLQ